MAETFYYLFSNNMITVLQLFWFAAKLVLEDSLAWIYLLSLGLTRISETEKIYILYTSETDKILGINSTDILTYSNSFETIVMLIETWWWILRKNEKLKMVSQWHKQLGRKKQSEYSCTPTRRRPCDHLVTIPDALPPRNRRNVDELRLCHSKHCITIPPIYKSGPARAFEYSGIQGLFSFRYTVFWCYKIWVLSILFFPHFWFGI